MDDGDTSQPVILFTTGPDGYTLRRDGDQYTLGREGRSGTWFYWSWQEVISWALEYAYPTEYHEAYVRPLEQYILDHSDPADVAMAVLARC